MDVKCRLYCQLSDQFWLLRNGCGQLAVLDRLQGIRIRLQQVFHDVQTITSNPASAARSKPTPSPLASADHWRVPMCKIRNHR